MSAYYDPPSNATRPYVVIISDVVSTTSTTIATVIRLLRNYEPTGSSNSGYFSDEVSCSVPASAYYVPPRPRKGAYVALLPRLPVVPSLEASPRSAPRAVRQAGWRLAVHTRHVTTSL